MKHPCVNTFRKVPNLHQKETEPHPPWIIRAVPIRDRSIFSVLFIMASFWIYYDFNGFLCLIRSIKDCLPMRARSLRAVQEMYLSIHDEIDRIEIMQKLTRIDINSVLIPK